MLAPSNSYDDLVLVGEARRVADDLIGAWGREAFNKALDLSTPEAFDRSVAALAGRLRRLARPFELAAVRAAIAVLDVDWARTTAEARGRLIASAMAAAGEATGAVLERIGAPF